MIDMVWNKRLYPWMRFPAENIMNYWIGIYNEQMEKPDCNDYSGKWLIFLSLDRLDDMWTKIANDVFRSKLGPSAKTRTKLTVDGLYSGQDRVICVYANDYRDRDDVMRIRERLRQRGVIWKIPFKTDNATLSGVYASNSRGRVSLYYE